MKYRNKTVKAKLAVFSLVIYLFSTTASAGLFLIPLILGLKGVATVVAVKTVVITKVSAGLLAKQSLAIKTVSQTAVVKSNGIKVGGRFFTKASIGTFLALYGLESSGTEYIDTMFSKELSSAKASGINDYRVKVCKNNDGDYYGVPSDTESCLNRSDPVLLKDGMDLSKFG